MVIGADILTDVCFALSWCMCFTNGQTDRIAIARVRPNIVGCMLIIQNIHYCSTRAISDLLKTTFVQLSC